MKSVKNKQNNLPQLKTINLLFALFLLAVFFHSPV